MPILENSPGERLVTELTQAVSQVYQSAQNVYLLHESPSIIKGTLATHIGTSQCTPNMLMSLDPNVAELCIFDLTVAMVPPAGVAQDLAHLERKCSVKGYVMEPSDKAIDKLEECLTGCDLVLIPAGMPRKPGIPMQASW